MELNNSEQLIIDFNGVKKWYKNNELYCILEINGTKKWYKNRKLHSYDDKPAYIVSNGDLYWYKDGKLHRDNDKPAVVYLDSGQFWYKEGQVHRDDDKPAVVYPERQEWWRYGKRYRQNISLPTYISKTIVLWFRDIILLNSMSKQKYDKITRLYSSIQLYRRKSAEENSTFYKKWNRSRILEPLLTGMIIVYI